MKRMNKLLALLLAVIMVASFAACGNEPTPTPDPEPTPRSHSRRYLSSYRDRYGWS